MRIIFLCGSLEPGRDGVGDYVRQLTLELQRQGHQAAAVALNDHYITEEIITLPQLVKEEISVLRLPSNWANNRRFGRAKQWIDDFQPIWISLQFVPYAFHQKGLPITLSKNLRQLVKDRQVHLMMHECWIGAELGTGLKRRLMSYLQRQVVSNLISQLGPAVIHTHLPIYQTRLQSLGWHVLPLPLFSNIPVSAQTSLETNSKIFRIGIFSQVNVDSTIIEFLKAFTTHLSDYHRDCQVQVLLIGGEPNKMRELESVLETIPNLRGRVCYTGFLEATQLSNVLQSCQLGLTTVPRNGLGKSGSVAAFLAHGIPVAAPFVHSEALFTDVGFFSASLRSAILVKPDSASYLYAKAAAQEGRNVIRLSKITQKFLTALCSKK